MLKMGHSNPLQPSEIFWNFEAVRAVPRQPPEPALGGGVEGLGHLGEVDGHEGGHVLLQGPLADLLVQRGHGAGPRPWTISSAVFQKKVWYSLWQARRRMGRKNTRIRMEKKTFFLFLWK